MMIVVKLKREKMEKMGKKETIIFRGGLSWGFFCIKQDGEPYLQAMFEGWVIFLFFS